MAEVLDRLVLFSYLSGNKSGSAYEHVAYLSTRKVKILKMLLLFFTVINAY